MRIPKTKAAQPKLHRNPNQIKPNYESYLIQTSSKQKQQAATPKQKPYTQHHNSYNHQSKPPAIISLTKKQIFICNLPPVFSLNQNI